MPTEDTSPPVPDASAESSLMSEAGEIAIASVDTRLSSDNSPPSSGVSMEAGAASSGGTSPPSSGVSMEAESSSATSLLSSGVSMEAGAASGPATAFSGAPASTRIFPPMES